ncbi:MAG: hypothetical protein JXP34_11890 [Planctomycetes bacterium]|nr:hypothetical protein [Planctomycetota bacterium]
MNARRIATTVAGGLAGALVAYWISQALVSEETRIRRLLHGMERAFNNEKAGPVMDGLADGFREETSGLGKEEIRALLSHSILTMRDPVTQDFIYRVALPKDDLHISMNAEDPKKAEATVRARFEEVHGENRRLVWDVEIDAALQKGDEGWQVARSRYRTLEGAPVLLR